VKPVPIISARKIEEEFFCIVLGPIVGRIGEIYWWFELRFLFLCRMFPVGFHLLPDLRFGITLLIFSHFHTLEISCWSFFAIQLHLVFPAVFP